MMGESLRSLNVDWRLENNEWRFEILSCVLRAEVLAQVSVMTGARMSHNKGLEIYEY